MLSSKNSKSLKTIMMKRKRVKMGIRRTFQNFFSRMKRYFRYVAHADL